MSIDTTEAFFGVANGITSFAFAQALGFFFALGTSERFEKIIASHPKIYLGIILGNGLYLAGLAVCTIFILILFLMSVILCTVREIKISQTAEASRNQAEFACLSRLLRFLGRRHAR